LPIQACLFLKAQGFKQKVHNLIILEEGSSLNLITGCTASKSANESIHIGVSEFFIKKSAKVNFTMIHSWKEDISAKPITAAIIDENGSFASNYICLKRVKSVSMYPTSILKGKKASAFFNSIILAHQGSEFDIGSKVIFKEKNTSSEIITRVASLGGKITARGSLKAESEEIRGHLECQGLLLSENGIIKAIPELESNHKEVDLSHEASIGKIHKDEIEYLRSKGLSEKNAKSLIISGFLNPEIINAPESTIKVIKDLEEKMLEGSL
jgi:Fe-S cluster assembly scaffold protein SufB